MASESSSEEVPDLLQSFKTAANSAKPAVGQSPRIHKQHVQSFGGVVLPAVANRHEYEDPPLHVFVERVLDELHREDNELEYQVQYHDGTTEIVSLASVEHGLH